MRGLGRQAHVDRVENALLKVAGEMGEVGSVRRVAVLPFENLGAPEDDYFADGMADAVRGKLTSVPLLKIPYYLSPGWLKVDPNFDPLRTNPRFQKLVAGAR